MPILQPTKGRVKCTSFANQPWYIISKLDKNLRGTQSITRQIRSRCLQWIGWDLIFSQQGIYMSEEQSLKVLRSCFSQNHLWEWLIKTNIWWTSESLTWEGPSTIQLTHGSLTWQMDQEGLSDVYLNCWVITIRQWWFFLERCVLHFPLTLKPVFTRNVAYIFNTIRSHIFSILSHNQSFSRITLRSGKTEWSLHLFKWVATTKKCLNLEIN